MLIEKPSEKKVKGGNGSCFTGAYRSKIFHFFGKELIRTIFMRLRIEMCLSGVFCGSHLPKTKVWAVVLLLCFVPTYLGMHNVF